jgi:hypothetical protein
MPKGRRDAHRLPTRYREVVLTSWDRTHTSLQSLPPVKLQYRPGQSAGQDPEAVW